MVSVSVVVVVVVATAKIVDIVVDLGKIVVNLVICMVVESVVVIFEECNTIQNLEINFVVLMVGLMMHLVSLMCG